MDPEVADESLGEQLGVGTYEDSDIQDGKIRATSSSSSSSAASEIERPSIKFDDVGGMEELKEEIKLKIIYPLQHPKCMRLMASRSAAAF